MPAGGASAARDRGCGPPSTNAHLGFEQRPTSAHTHTHSGVERDWTVGAMARKHGQRPPACPQRWSLGKRALRVSGSGLGAGELGTGVTPELGRIFSRRPASSPAPEDGVWKNSPPARIEGVFGRISNGRGPAAGEPVA